MIDKDGGGAFGDFGMTTVTHTLNTVNAATHNSCGGTIRYMAPELIHPRRFGLEKVQASCAADIYAFGMVMWQVRPILCTW